jgi:GNAT superfamily N-acetyltransferase
MHTGAPPGYRIRAPARLSTDEIAELCDVLIDCVDGGASVSFMLPMTRTKAEAFWRSTATALERGALRVLLAESDGGRVVGSVQVLLDQPENQPHRGALAKMLVHRASRRQGIGAALLKAAEALSQQLGKTLLVLDTASGDAERLYARQGWVYSGEIPGYALWPAGGACATKIFYKVLRPA